MAAVTNPDVESVPTTSHDWETVRAAVLTRDSYTCQRCEYTPRTGGDTRVLHAHRLLTGRSEPVAPTPLTGRYVTLCAPCHGVQHPLDATFDDCRQRAQITPSYHAHPDVALLNPSHPEYNSVDAAVWLQHRTFDRDEYRCQRCDSHGVSPHGKMPGVKLTAYVADRPVEHGFACVRHLLTICRPCFRLVQGTVDDKAVSTTDRLLPDSDAHPEVAVPRPPQTEAEREDVRQFITQFCFERDSHTCNRCCSQIRAHPSDYDHPLVSLYTPYETESVNPADYVLLCTPCYATLNPHERTVQAFLPYAPREAHPRAHPWVDVDKSHYRPQDLQTLTEGTIRTIFDTYSHQCQRCMSRRLEEGDLVAYPGFDVTADVVEHPFEEYVVMCRPCASVVHHNGDDRTSLDDLHALRPLDSKTFEDESAGARPTPAYPVLHDVVDVERGPVNRKERLLLNSALRKVHVAWKLGGTVSIATALFFWMLTSVMWIDRSMISLPFTGWTASPWVALTGFLVLLALFLASTIRWTTAEVTGRLWAAVDPTIESHHYRVDAPHEWARTIEAYAYLFGIPYIVAVLGHVLFLVVLTLHWALF